MSQWAGPFTVTCNSAGAGVSLGIVDTPAPIQGKVKLVLFDFHSSTAVGSIVTTLKTKGTLAPSYNILVRTNSVSAGPFQPTFVSQDTTGTDRTYDGTRKIPAPIPVNDFLSMTVAGANSADQIDVYIMVD
jgi:hypothetical protein